MGVFRGLSDVLRVGFKFRCRIDIFLRDAGVRLIVNGEVTEWVVIGRSVRQGDLLVLALYVFLMDFLIFRINQDGRVKGLVDFWGREYKIVGFADDMFLVFRSIGESVEVAMFIISEFSTVRGVR